MLLDAGSDDEHASDDDGTCSEPPPAQWMSGKWGIGWRIRFGEVQKFDVDKLVRQIEGVPGVDYVLFGLSEGAKGGRYIAPHSVLSEISPASCPERDLFDELATAFQAAGYRVLVYMATEGPPKLKHGAADNYDYDEDTETSPSVERWKEYVKGRYGDDDVATLKRAYADVIVKEYAERYGTKIDGWWFDHATTGNIPLLHKVCKGANPKAITTFNSGKLPCAQNSHPGYEDYTFGHPTPTRRAECSAPENEVMVKAVEESEDGYLYKDGEASLGHLFMPLMKKWNKGKEPVWTEEQAVDWMSRVLGAGGAWTWNVPEDHQKMKLSGKAVKFMKSVSEQLNV